MINMPEIFGPGITAPRVEAVATTAPTTAESMAANPDVLAVFVFNVRAISEYAPTHGLAERFGDVAGVWHRTAESFAESSHAANLAPESLAAMRLGNQHRLCYMHAHGRALVVVTRHGSDMHKSIKRTMKTILRRLGKRTEVAP